MRDCSPQQRYGRAMPQVKWNINPRTHEITMGIWYETRPSWRLRIRRWRDRANRWLAQWEV